MASNTLAFTHLTTKLSEWKAAGLLVAPHKVSEDEFRAHACTLIHPTMQALADTLTQAGLPSEVVHSVDEHPAIGVEIKNYEVAIWLSPAASRSSVQATAISGPRGSNVANWLIPYSIIRNGGLERELQQAVLRLIGPRR